jgi:hypothetical protein
VLIQTRESGAGNCSNLGILRSNSLAEMRHMAAILPCKFTGNGRRRYSPADSARRHTRGCRTLKTCAICAKRSEEVSADRGYCARCQEELDSPDD